MPRSTRLGAEMAKCCAMSTDVGQLQSAGFGRTWWESAKVGPPSTDLGQFGLSRPNLAGQNSSDFRRYLGRVGRARARFRPRSGPPWEEHFSGMRIEQRSIPTKAMQCSSDEPARRLPCHRRAYSPIHRRAGSRPFRVRPVHNLADGPRGVVRGVRRHEEDAEGVAATWPETSIATRVALS